MAIILILAAFGLLYLAALTTAIITIIDYLKNRNKSFLLYISTGTVILLTVVVLAFILLLSLAIANM